MGLFQDSAPPSAGSSDLWAHEAVLRPRHYQRIAGIDEAGRGPLAGPVVSAAVILPSDFPVTGLTDSKQLTPRQREVFYSLIYRHAVGIGIGIVDAGEIDRINILQASLLSMRMAVCRLQPPPDYLLIDGIYKIEAEIPQQALPKGDSRSYSIAAASIVAKVTRDRLMETYDTVYPQFGFASHKGYPTKMHRESIRRHGCCLIHRRSFAGVKEFLPNVMGQNGAPVQNELTWEIKATERIPKRKSEVKMARNSE